MEIRFRIVLLVLGCFVLSGNACAEINYKELKEDIERAYDEYIYFHDTAKRLAIEDPENNTPLFKQFNDWSEGWIKTSTDYATIYIVLCKD